jgi:hypothetical protein
MINVQKDIEIPRAWLPHEGGRLSSRPGGQNELARENVAEIYPEGYLQP